MKVRSILAHKGLPYERVPVLGPSLWELLQRSRVGKVPALDMDGRLVVDSTDIALALDRLQPHPPLLPEEPQQRALCQLLEDWSDEALYFLGLHYQWMDPRGQPLVRRAFGASLLGIALRLFYQRRIAAQLIALLAWLER